MKFFFDNNLGTNLANGFRAFGEDVVHLVDEFHQNADDTQWLPIIGQRGWVLVTKDRRIRYRPAEIAAYRSNRIGGFVLSGKNVNGWAIIQQLVRNWPRMKELVEKTRAPFLYRVPPRGKKIEQIPI